MQLSWSWLVQHLCLLYANGQTKVVTCVGKLVMLVCMSDSEGALRAVIGKERVTDDGCLGLGNGFQSFYVKELPIYVEPDIEPQDLPC